MGINEHKWIIIALQLFEWLLSMEGSMKWGTHLKGCERVVLGTRGQSRPGSEYEMKERCCTEVAFQQLSWWFCM